MGSRAKVLVAAALVAAISTGCGASGSRPGASGPPIADGDPGASATHRPEGLAEHGLVLFVCDHDNGYRLESIDPGTGAVSGTVVLPMDLADPVMSLDPRFGSCGEMTSPVWRTRELFDRDFTRMVLRSSQRSDGSRHVGWIDLASGRITDVTARTSGHGFSSMTPVDNAPAFDPITGDFWWARGLDDVLSIDPETLKVTDHHLESGGGNYAYAGQFMLTEGTPDASGRRAAAVWVPAIGRAPVVRVLDSTHGLNEFETANPAGRDVSVAGLDGGCRVEGWLDDSHVIVNDTIGSACPTSVIDLDNPALVRILPANDHVNHDFVVSPDRGTIAFVSAGGGKIGIYRSSGSATRDPRCLYTIPGSDGTGVTVNARLLAWR